MGDVANVIKVLRANIQEAMQEGAGKDVRFDLGEIELELHTVISKSGDVELNGGMDIKVFAWDIAKVEAKGAGQYHKEDTNVIRLKLTPIQKDKKTGKTTGVQVNDVD